MAMSNSLFNVYPHVIPVLAECNGALGMETMEIPDVDISASSSFDENSVGPANARYEP